MIALELVEAFRCAGASVFMAHTLQDALPLADHPDLSAAVLDVRLKEGDAAAICDRLHAREIPFVLYSGREPDDAAFRNGVYVPKPSASEVLIDTVAGLLH